MTSPSKGRALMRRGSYGVGIVQHASGFAHRAVENRERRRTRTELLLLLLAPSLLAFGQSGSVSVAAADQASPPAQSAPLTIGDNHPDELNQELDADAIALSKIPADPLIQPDPVAPILRPINMIVDHSIHSMRLKFGATYTLLNQYATITPDGVRHDQPSGRLDFTGAWTVFDMKAPGDPSACWFVPGPTLA